MNMVDINYLRNLSIQNSDLNNKFLKMAEEQMLKAAESGLRFCVVQAPECEGRYYRLNQSIEFLKEKKYKVRFKNYDFATGYAVSVLIEW